MAIGVSATVTRTNLFSQTYANLYNLINDRSNIPDPIGETERKFVYRRVPNVKGTGFNIYPFIVIFPSSPDIENLALSNTRGDVPIEFTVEIWSSDEVRGRYASRGAEFLDTISDALMSIINNASNKLTIRNRRQANMNIVTEDSDTLDFKNETIFVRRFTISFKTRMTVST